jgi:poly(glycerol-phosphate) alpha-glucosyltransferase
MTSPFLPAGRYLVAFNQVRTVAGGQTHSLLQRTWLFAEEAGVPSTVVTFDAYPDYGPVETDLRERGKLHPTTALLNIYDWFRDHGEYLEDGADRSRLVDLHHLRSIEEHREDGSVWRTRFDDPVNLQPVFYDYRRADGTVFLRTPPLSLDEFKQQPDLVQYVDRDGHVTQSWSTLGGWFTRWLEVLTRDDDAVFLFYDSMMLPPHMSPLLPPEIHQVATMHMAHVYHPRRWNSPQHEPARRSLEQLEHFDAFVVLTERQRQDVEGFYGSRSNLFVLPNPGETAETPDPLPERDPRRLVVIARLERVKRVDDAIRAFASVVREMPAARLDIYGEGRLRLAHQRLVDELGLRGSVTLHGHRPDARDRLWECSGLLLTSRSEGYPLAPLEAFARACPVVSYDIKYGPREQIEDGVSGFLAPAGDTEALAAQCLKLVGSPDVVAGMGRAGRERVAHDREAYVGRWAAILQAAVVARGRRTRLEKVRLDVDVLGWAGGGRHARLGRRRMRSGTGGQHHVEFRGQLHVDAARTAADPADAVVALDAVNDSDATVVPLPLDVTRDGLDFALSTRFDLRHVAEKVPAGRVNLRLRLRFTWHNSSWETNLSRPRRLAPDIEAAYLDDGQIRLRAR